ncbi:hypothetical protein IEU95_15795 [Hoyosella rhizosphaerae]|uniref:Uncharacterized protein n=1 Tax=Hoyosella rhizosphaerae TaxID=1755582 RepID=A0A916XHI2_9ACTN|nr:hypothetical protein [Hoyosella rhizosphaerae]MBN4928298.1 hypothetical protein [Hoyosella rhizosphaerae]GGC73903.1 hypothetical protein GCM10011410_28850 [Hoyosella rhizosphaerae]
MTNPQYTPLDIARGDVDLSRQIEKSLTITARHTDNPELKRLIHDVLARRISVRDMAMTTAFSAIAQPASEEFARRHKRMNDDQRRRMTAQAERDIARRQE